MREIFILLIMKRKNILTSALSFVTFLFVVPQVFAANPPPELDAQKIATWINQVVDAIFPFLTFVAFVMLLYGGFMYMSATGDPGKVKQAQGTITWAMIGLVFVILMGLIANAFFDFLLK